MLTFVPPPPNELIDEEITLTDSVVIDVEGTLEFTTPSDEHEDSPTCPASKCIRIEETQSSKINFPNWCKSQPIYTMAKNPSKNNFDKIVEHMDNKTVPQVFENFSSQNQVNTILE